MTKKKEFSNRQPWRIDSRERAVLERISDLSYPPDWEGASCSIIADPDLFFPQIRSSYNQRRQIQTAKNVCSCCDIQEKCLDYALKNSIVHGIWGGMTPNERRTAKRIKQWVTGDRYP